MNGAKIIHVFVSMEKGLITMFKRIVISLFIYVLPVSAGISNTIGDTVSLEMLAERCRQMENSIRDLKCEYEWYTVPAWSREELKRLGADSNNILLSKDGVVRMTFSAARLSEPNEMNGRSDWALRIDKVTMLSAADGKEYQSIVQESYDGDVLMRYEGPESKGKAGSGFVVLSDKCPGFFMTPLDFSVLRLANDIDGVPLSKRLADTRLARLGDGTENINGFDAIYVDLLQEQTKQPCIRVYFSIKNDYTPIKYEYFNSGKAGTRIAYSVEAANIVKTGTAGWLPSSGLIVVAGKDRVNGFEVNGSILVNQGLSEKDFVLDFPVGTKVEDRVASRSYVVTEPDE